MELFFGGWGVAYTHTPHTHTHTHAHTRTHTLTHTHTHAHTHTNTHILSIWLQRNLFCQLATRDEQLYRSLASLREMGEQELEELQLPFTVTRGELTGHEEVELLRGGAEMQVTKRNLPVFLVYVGDFYLNRDIDAATSALRGGLHVAVKREWLQLFGPSELQMLLSGTQADIDIDDLKRNTVLHGDYTAQHPTVVLFWRVVEEMSAEDRALLLRFVTSCPRPPLQGFAHLNPQFAIRNALDAARLPSASTCVNLLKLPPYDTLETMRDKLLTAIRSKSGFHLS